jgi:hypothetical protein
MNPNDPSTQPEQPPAYVPQQASQPQSQTQDPGKGLGIAGFILAFFFPFIGIILSIVGYVKSKRAGFKNGLALAGIILNSVFLVLGTVILALVTMVAYAGIQQRANTASAATTASGVVKMAEVYNAENGEYNGESVTARYPKAYADIAATVQNTTLATSAMTGAPADANTVEFYACGDQTGNKVGYWNFREDTVNYIYAGDASADSTDCKLVTH